VPGLKVATRDSKAPTEGRWFRTRPCSRGKLPRNWGSRGKRAAVKGISPNRTGHRPARESVSLVRLSNRVPKVQQDPGLRHIDSYGPLLPLTYHDIDYYVKKFLVRARASLLLVSKRVW